MLARRKLIAMVTCGLPSVLAGSVRAQDETWPTGASEHDTQAALSAINQWIAAYQAGDYEAQWRLTDPRIRRWFDLRRFQRAMQLARRRDGALLSYVVGRSAAASAAQLPCTEQGHCFRERVPYVIALLDTHYETASPPQPEFCVAARSREGWTFGGGTILNRPLGETAVILTLQDERRYAPSWTTRP